MKIVFIINTLQLGGAAKMLKYVASLTLNYFSNVTIIDIYDEVSIFKEVDERIKIRFLGLGKKSRVKRQILLIPKLRESIIEEIPDVVFSFVGHVNVFSRIATIDLKEIIFLSAERGDPYTQSWIWQRLTKWAYKKSDFCFFQLEGARDFFGKSVKEHSFVIPNPYIKSDYTTPYLGYRNKTIVSAGRFAKEKCFDLLIKAYYQVHKLYPDYRLILFGEGPMLKEYKKLIKKLNIEDYVDFPGYVTSVSQSIRKEGIFVLSSSNEGIPNSLIEAMSVGIPCISTNCPPGGPDFLTKNGKRALLIPINNEKALVESLLIYIKDQTIANSFGKKALEVISELREDKISDMWKKAFDVILKTKR